MSDTPFHQTAMGRDFYERTMPGLVREIAKLNTLLEKVVAAHPESPVAGKSSGESETP